MKKLERAFYARNTIDVATALLGCEIVSFTGGIKTSGIIVETEAYIGTDDPACHAHRGLTKRNRVMFGIPGVLYVYFTYGNHFMLNIVTERDGYPAAALLRAIEPQYGIEEMSKRRGTTEMTHISSGPGKLAKALAVTTSDNGTDLTGKYIYLRGPAKRKYEIMVSTRIGIGEGGSDKLWRFFIKGNPYVSPSNSLVKESVVPLAKARELNFLYKGVG